MKVAEIMKNIESVVRVSDDAEDALNLMRAKGMEVAPVVSQDGDVVGLIWRSDLGTAEPDNLDETLEQTFPASDPISPA